MNGMVLITGSRGWNRPDLIERVLMPLDRDLLVIAGGAPGADIQARVKARRLGFHVAQIDALWHHDRRGAGHKRNDVMLALWCLQPRYAFAFWDGQSPGTSSMIGKIKTSGYGELLEILRFSAGEASTDA